METNRVDLETPVHAYFSALNRQELEHITELFTDDAVLMLNDSETLVGQDAVRAFYEHRFSAVRFGRNLHIDEMSADGDLAFVRAHSTGTVKPLVTGKAMDVSGRELFVLQRVSGIWKIQCYMMNHPKE